MKWISGSATSDVLAFILPGLSAIVAVSVFAPDSSLLVVAMILGAVIDSGHVYTTGWRLWRPGLSHPRQNLFGLILLGTIALSWALIQTNPLILWRLLLYFTLFHHVRQYYGLTRWYEMLNGTRHRWTGLSIYLLTALPMLGFHFRSDVNFGLFSPRDHFIFPSEILLQATLALWALVFLVWIAAQFRSPRELNRTLAIGFPALMHGYCFFYSSTLTQTALPLLISHGITYALLMGISLQKSREPRWSAPYRVGILMVLTIALCGLWEVAVESLGEGRLDLSAPLSAGWALILIAPLAPALWHYIVDGIIWKRSDPQMNDLLN